MKAAQAFGWDVVNPFELRFVRGREGWEISSGVQVQGGDLQERSGVEPFDQDNCWMWKVDQVLPHRISPQVFKEIRNQVKVSTYLFLQTPPGWVLLMTDIPNLQRDFWVRSALLDSDWYFPAHPWHAVIELPEEVHSQVGDEVVIPAGEPLCRLIPVRRGAYTAAEMDSEDFVQIFQTGQEWLTTYGRPHEDPEAPKGALDITRAFAKQQRMASFEVQPSPSSERGRRGASRRRRGQRA